MRLLSLILWLFSLNAFAQVADKQVIGLEEEEQTIFLVQNTGADFISLHEIPRGCTAYVHDSFGRLILSRKLNNEWVSFNTAYWPPGIYVIQVIGENVSFGKKILKQ